MSTIPTLRRLKQEDLEFREAQAKKLVRPPFQQTSQVWWCIAVIPVIQVRELWSKASPGQKSETLSEK
jgi:hypothetical protein